MALAGYGAGGYGLGDSGVTVLTGTPIAATDWTSDNWGEIALACPYGGAVYQYDPTSGFLNASPVATAPPFNGGIFVSTTLQILFCWGSSETQGIGVERDPMLISWSDQGDYTVFTPSHHEPSRIIPGILTLALSSVEEWPSSNQSLFWTDLDSLGSELCRISACVFGFNKIGAGAGAPSHAMQQLRGAVYWMGLS